MTAFSALGKNFVDSSHLDVQRTYSRFSIEVISFFIGWTTYLCPCRFVSQRHGVNHLCCFLSSVYVLSISTNAMLKDFEASDHGTTNNVELQQARIRIRILWNQTDQILTGGFLKPEIFD
ncbi:hypothetical protein HNY73_015169 [Argiope bruennichi]|uniref:Uncharacterized protein n=1 Tax=Argiope bruennichi TaxID=94029 RepID=A0A8T0EVX2_ARGBR|nr:hypothetical protein HNY73_015169 [Argiope bruennichi]